MCGITGMFHATSTRFFQSDANLFFGLMLINSLRGNASTGVFGVTEKDETDIYKALGHPYDWNSWKASDEWMEAMVKKHYAVVAHGRLPTQGTVSIDNAHPFEHKSITLVHNGTLTNFKELQATHKTSFGTDSQLITYLIGEYGIEETVKQIEGAYALVWHDSKDEKGGLHFLRNSQRPLCYGKNLMEDKFLFASEPHYIKWAVSKGYSSIEKVEHFDTDVEYHLTSVGFKLDIVKTLRKPPSKWSGTSYSPSHSWKPTTPFPSKVITCLDEDVTFNVVELHALDNQAEKDYSVMIKGEHVDNANIKIFTHLLKGESLKDKKTPFKMIGRIRKLTCVQTDTNFEVRVFVDNPKELKDTKIITLPPGNGVQMVELKDGMKISLGKFLEYSKEGCFNCDTHPELSQAAQCTVSKHTYIQHGQHQEDYIFLCQHCSTENPHYGFMH